MSTSKNTIQNAIFEVLQQMSLIILSVAIFWIDVNKFDQTFSENSITENVQAMLILLSIFIFATEAYRKKESRGLFVLVAGFFATMLIRESDAFFDQIVHGFWVYPAVAVTVASIVYASRCKNTVAAPLAAFTQTKAFSHIVFGLLILMVFSRLFGTGSLWRIVMGPDYSNPYRDAIQEGIELLGYLYIAYGSLLFRTRERRTSSTSPS